MQDRLPLISRIKSNQILHILIIIIVGFIVYSRSFHNLFLEDDFRNIDASLKAVSPLGSRYIPYLTFATNFYLGGINVTGYHLFNLIIHIANAVLIYILLQLIFLTPAFFASANNDRKNFMAVAFIAAMFFLSHPIQTTTVYFISLRITSIATFFYLLTIIVYLKARLNKLESKGYALYMLFALLFTVVAMKSKEISFTIPITITLTEFTFFYKKTTRKEFLYLFLFSLTFLIIPLSRLDIFDHTGIFHGSSNLKSQTPLISRYEYLLTQFKVIAGYLKSLLLPTNLHWAPYYRLSKSFFEIKTITSFIMLLFIFSSGILLLRDGLEKKKGELLLLSFGILWFFITLLVESSIIPIEDLSLDHRTYLPSAGFFMVISATLIISMRKFCRYVPLLLIFMFLIITVCSFNSYIRHSVFKNQFALWGDSVLKDPGNPFANCIYGYDLYKARRYKEALPFLLKAINSKDEYFLSRISHRGIDNLLYELIKDCYLNIQNIEKSRQVKDENTHEN